jgi:hypothetical protein
MISSSGVPLGADFVLGEAVLFKNQRDDEDTQVPLYVKMLRFTDCRIKGWKWSYYLTQKGGPDYGWVDSLFLKSDSTRQWLSRDELGDIPSDVDDNEPSDADHQSGGQIT